MTGNNVAFPWPSPVSPHIFPYPVYPDSILVLWAEPTNVTPVFYSKVSTWGSLLTLIISSPSILTLIIQMRSQSQCKIYLNSQSNYLQIPSLLQSTRYLSTLWEILLTPTQTLTQKTEKPSNTFWTLHSTVQETPHLSQRINLRGGHMAVPTSHQRCVSAPCLSGSQKCEFLQLHVLLLPAIVFNDWNKWWGKWKHW